MHDIKDGVCQVGILSVWATAPGVIPPTPYLGGMGMTAEPRMRVCSVQASGAEEKKTGEGGMRSDTERGTGQQRARPRCLGPYPVQQHGACTPTSDNRCYVQLAFRASLCVDRRI